jgi:transposase
MGSIAHVGIDVHEGKFRIAILGESGRQFLEERTVGGEAGQVVKLLRPWQEQYQVQCYYEAGPLGYGPYRWLQRAGVACQVIAPSKTPRGPGDRVRTDARDARRLAQQGRAGTLVAVHIPTPEEEAAREVVRCRVMLGQELTGARQRVRSWLLRHDYRYPKGKEWTQPYGRWLREIQRGLPGERPEAWTFTTLLGEVGHFAQEVAEADRQVAQLAQGPAYRAGVGRLGCFRGIEVLGAMLILTESGDFARFPSAPGYAAYWGLTGSEESTGQRRHLGGITKCGQAHMRWIWIQIAWHYTHPPALGRTLQRRQAGQPGRVIDIAWQAQRRLYRKYRRLTERRGAGKAVVAVARELTGFVWAAMSN